VSKDTILLVEDDPNSVYFFRYALGKLRIENPLQVAKHGLEAIEYLEGVGEFANRERFPVPKLVLLDLRMPYATGFEVLEKIRSCLGRGKVVVVVFTSSSSDSDISQAYRLGANGYIVKPSQLGELLKIVQSIRDFWMTLNETHPGSLSWQNETSLESGSGPAQAREPLG